jgi:hypothetical protein
MELRIGNNRTCAHCGGPILEREAWHWATVQPRPDVWAVQSVHSHPNECRRATESSAKSTGSSSATR